MVALTVIPEGSEIYFASFTALSEIFLFTLRKTDLGLTSFTIFHTFYCLAEYFPFDILDQARNQKKDNQQ